MNRAREFRRLGEELNVLEYDLTSVLFVFKMAYQLDYQGGEYLSLTKFSIVYHIDNAGPCELCRAFFRSQ